MVGVRLTSFGIFWAGEGAGVDWPGSDVAVLGIVAYVGLVSFALTRVLRRRKGCAHTDRGGTRMRRVRAFARFWWVFVVGDDRRVAADPAAGHGLTWLPGHARSRPGGFCR